MANDDLPAPVNMSDDINDMIAFEAGVMSAHDSPLLGVLTLVTPVGHYDFLVNQDVANTIIQGLRELLRGDSEPLVPE